MAWTWSTQVGDPILQDVDGIPEFFSLPSPLNSLLCHDSNPLSEDSIKLVFVAYLTLIPFSFPFLCRYCVCTNHFLTIPVHCWYTSWRILVHRNQYIAGKVLCVQWPWPNCLCTCAGYLYMCVCVCVQCMSVDVSVRKFYWLMHSLPNGTRGHMQCQVRHISLSSNMGGGAQSYSDNINTLCGMHDNGVAECSCAWYIPVCSTE